MNMILAISALIYSALFIGAGLWDGNVEHRVFMFLVTLDAFLFMLICLGNVRFGECASSAAWDMYLAGKWRGRAAVAVIDTLFFFTPNHCRKSWEWQRHLYDKERA